MKTLFATTALLLMFCMTHSQTETRNVNSNLHAVVVYMSGAELHHTATVRLTAGKQELIFTGLSEEMIQNTLLVDIQKKDVTILSVSSRTNYLEPIKDNEKINRLKDSLAIAKEKLAQYESRIQTLNKEKDLLFKNEAIGGTTHGVSVAEITKAADFYRQRMFDIDDALANYKRQLSVQSNTRKNLEKQIQELNATFNPPSSEVHIVVMSPSSTETDFSIKYQVPSAGWEPKYDVRSEGITKPVDLIYRANIYNNCGIDWESVKIKLSTADPNQGAEKPKLESWDLGEVQLNEQWGYGYGGAAGATAPVQQELTDKSGIVDVDVEEEKIGFNSIFGNEEIELKNYAEPIRRKSAYINSQGVATEMVEVAELSAEFEITQEYTILSDSKPYIVEVSKHSLPAKYEHFAVPKMDVDAFLVAKIAGWNALNLVSGNASVYYNGSYLGESYINTASVEDTLVLSMGRDKKISMVRTKISELSKKTQSGNSVKESFVFETTIKNNRDVTIVVNVEDQLPISSDKEIQIIEEAIGEGTLDKLSGKIEYQFSLQPGESKTLKLSYHVKSPKARSIRGSKQIRRARAKF